MKKTQKEKTDNEQRLFSERLLCILHNKKISQSQLAESLGLSRQSVNSYCNGKMFPDVSTLAKLAAALEVSCDYLLGLSDVPAIDTDIKAAAKLTGLSSTAIEALQKINSLERGLGGFKTTRTLSMLDDILEALLFDFRQYEDATPDEDAAALLCVSELEQSALGVLADIYQAEQSNSTGYAITINGNTAKPDEAHAIMQIIYFNKLIDALNDLTGAE